MSLRLRDGALAWAAFAWLVACARESSPAPTAAAPSVGAPSASEAAVLAPAAVVPPLEAPSWVVPLAVPGFAAATAAVPVGARGPRPVVVALHGNFDRPEWACGSWRSVTGPEPFILCTRGNARPDAPPSEPRFTYAGAAAAGHELAAARAALRVAYAPYLPPVEAPAVYAGFSLGAIVGVAIVTAAPRAYPRVVFVEGGHDGWTDEAARRFAKGGGERVLFVCSQRGCRGDAARAARTLERAGVRARVVDAGDHGHTYDGEVATATRAAWPWLVEGLPGFAPDAQR